MIIDAHTHAFPEASIENPSKWAVRHGEPHWSQLVLPRNGRPSLQGWVRRPEFLQSQREEGIDRSVLLGWYWENPETCALHNDEMTDWIREHSGQISAFAAVHADGPPPREVVAEAISAGFSGLGELHPAVQGSSLNDPFWQELAGLAAEAGLPLNFHVTEAVGRPHPGNVPTPFPAFLELVEAHPRLRIILSHWGGGVFLHELNPYIRKRFGNVFYDCSASPLLYESRIFPVAHQIVGAEKILFGSDFPLRLYPGTDALPGRHRFLREIHRLGLPEADVEKIVWRNAKRLLQRS